MIKPLCQEVFELCIMMNIFVPGNNADFCVTFVTWHNNVLLKMCVCFQLHGYSVMQSPSHYGFNDYRK